MNIKCITLKPISIKKREDYFGEEKKIFLNRGLLCGLISVYFVEGLVLVNMVGDMEKIIGFLKVLL